MSKYSLINQTYKNISSGWISISIVASVNIVLTPILLEELGKSAYGIWLIVFNILSYLYLSDFGITNSITRLYSKYSMSDPSRLEKLVSTSYFFIFCIDAVLILLFVSISDSLFYYLELDDSNYQIYSFIVIVAIFEIAIQLVLRLNIGILKGTHRYDLTYKIEGFSSILRISTILIFLKLELFDIYTFAIIYSGSRIIADSVSIYFIKDIIKKVRPFFDVVSFKEIFNIGSSSIIITIANTIVISLPIVLFGKFFGVESVVLYSIPLSIMIILSRLINTVYQGLIPRSSELKSIGIVDDIFNISSFSTKTSLAIGFVFLGFFIVFGDEIIKFWLGDNALLEGEFRIVYNILVLMLFYVFIETSIKANVFILKSTGRHWLVTTEVFFGVLIMYLCSFVFYEYLHKYVFAASLVLLSVFKFIFYKIAIYRYKVEIYSMPSLVLLLSLLYACLLLVLSTYVYIVGMEKMVLFLFFTLSYCAIVYTKVLTLHERSGVIEQLNLIKEKVF